MSKISTFILSTTDGEEWAVSSNWKVKREDTPEIFGEKKEKKIFSQPDYEIYSNLRELISKASDKLALQ